MYKNTNTIETTEPRFFHYNRDISVNMSTSHYHETYEIYFLLSGTRRYFINHRIYDLIPGDIVLIPKNILHKVLNPPDSVQGEYHERYLLTPREEQIPKNLQDCFKQNFYRLPKEASDKIKGFIQQMQDEVTVNDLYIEQAYEAYLTNILITLIRSGANSIRNTKLKQIDYIMQDASLYIQENYSKNLSLRELAEKYYFTNEYFSCEFKKSTGFGFNEYLNHTRITHAIHLLMNTKLRITEISEQCGFNDSNYFSLVFKRITGLTPMKYRNEHI